ncbi:putative MFS family arabinose efflux permease [Stackebrandtia endophytica]|uniref:Putative MFS family arabinose efflux permease n=1 Tax=Stackebrandtia endophytica TaxID=1496996 RepID=A0A543B108_9ACTN|nr:MFS transporter [Stackebrandtia endophytica]TQL78508.1 putative MFS family arabinose efflux permease [Stackebrandtia endophytica]
MTQTHTRSPERSPSLLRTAGLPYFVIAFIARLPFAMMVVGVLTAVASVRDSLALAGLTSAAVGLGTAVFGPFLGAAADRFSQRRVLLVLAAANSAALVVFTLVVYSTAGAALVLAAALVIGATAPQVAPLSRSRLVTIITARMEGARRQRTMSSTMAYESAADETVFVFGPFLVGILASFIGAWAPLVIAAVLIMVFVAAFALHPTGRNLSSSRHEDGSAPSAASELFRPALLLVVAGITGVGLLFGATLTSLTAFMADRNEPESAGLFYGVMGIGSALLALGVAWLPTRFPLRTRWLVFAVILLAGTSVLAFASTTGAVMFALALMGIGVGPTLVTQYSLGVARSPLGRSATVMTMLGSGVILGQALGAAITGELADRFGTTVALAAPAVAAAIVTVTAVAHWILDRADSGRRISQDR